MIFAFQVQIAMKIKQHNNASVRTVMVENRSDIESKKDSIKIESKKKIPKS